jgi:hypothetical protein
MYFISMKSKIIYFQKYWVHGLNINDLSDEDFHKELVFTTSNAIGSVSIPVVLTEEKGLEFFIICIAWVYLLNVSIFSTRSSFGIFNSRWNSDGGRSPSGWWTHILEKEISRQK